MAKQKRLWEGAFTYGAYLLFHEFVKGDDGRPRFKDWALYPLEGNENLPYLNRPKGEVIETARTMRELKTKADELGHLA